LHHVPHHELATFREAPGETIIFFIPSTVLLSCICNNFTNHTYFAIIIEKEISFESISSSGPCVVRHYFVLDSALSLVRPNMVYSLAKPETLSGYARLSSMLEGDTFGEPNIFRPLLLVKILHLVTIRLVILN